MTGCVYALRDPETLELRYIGQTRHTPQARLAGHLMGAEVRDPKRVNKLTHWLQNLPCAPKLTVLEDGIPAEALLERERFHIELWKRRGARLVNTVHGQEVS